MLFAKNPSKSTLAHDTVAATVLHKRHPIICIGAGFISLALGHGSHVIKNSIFDIFSREFNIVGP